MSPFRRSRPAQPHFQAPGFGVGTVANPQMARTVAAIEEQAHEMGCDLLLAHSLNLTEREDICVRRLLSRRVDGLFIFPVYRLADRPDL